MILSFYFYSETFSFINIRIKAIRIIIEVLKNGTSKKELALRYNVSQTAIYMVCTGKNFPHIFQGYQKKYNKEVLALAKK